MRATAKNDKGFALIEVLLALLFVGMTLPAIIYSIGVMTNSAYQLKTRTVANWVAKNKMVELRLMRQRGQSLQGSSSGSVEMVGVEWYWQAETTPTQMDGLNRLRITVGLKPDSPETTLDTFIHQ